MRDYSTIYNLITLGNIISEYKYSLTKLAQAKHDERTNNAIFHAFSSQAIILTNSFIDEYDNFFKSSDQEFKEKIFMVKNIVKPAISKIREWNGIRDFRNNVLCHNLRKNKKSVFINGEIHNYNIPNNIIDLQIMTECIAMVTSAIQFFFEVEYEEFNKNIAKVDSSFNPKEEEVNSKKEELNKIYEEIKINWQKYNFTLPLSVRSLRR